MVMRELNLFSVNGLPLVIGAIGLSLLAATFSSADVCDDAQTPVEYDSTSGDKPDATSDWSRTCIDVNGVDSFVTNPDGVLIINDTSISTKAKYCAQDLFDDSCETRQDAVYEFSCKAIQVAENSNAWSDHGARFVFSCGFSTGDGSDEEIDDYDIRVAITLDQGIGFFEVDELGDASWLSVGGIDQHIDMSQTGGVNTPWTQSHVFRVEKNGVNVFLYIDNNPDPSLKFNLTNLANNYLEDEISLLGTSNPGKSKFELSHFRYRIASTNFTEPASSTCLGDVDGDDDVDIDDLMAVLAEWGPCIGCDEDINDDDVVGLTDLKAVLLTWGLCVP